LRRCLNDGRAFVSAADASQLTEHGDIGKGQALSHQPLATAEKIADCYDVAFDLFDDLIALAPDPLSARDP
jgi:hypothetical protein